MLQKREISCKTGDILQNKAIFQNQTREGFEVATKALSKYGQRRCRLQAVFD
jgi:hypothetical protein